MAPRCTALALALWLAQTTHAAGSQQPVATTGGAQELLTPASYGVIPRPAALQGDVDFWIRVYTEISTLQGFLHDERNLEVVYETIKVPSELSNKARQKIIDDARDRHVLTLRRLATALEQLRTGEDAAAAVAALGAEAQRVHALWGQSANPARFTEASRTIRFQLGQSDRFRAGIVRSGAWEAHIAEVLANRGLPSELATLPHVESSFNPAAYSKVGAAGLWQFMRSTGRRYLRIDDAVDERMDPFRATEAAAQLLEYNFRVLGSWPLALTAYNHGAAGLRRAVQALGTNDYMAINRGFKSPSFGFASRNFYPSFLAALTIDRNPSKYFGPIERLPDQAFHEVELPGFVDLATLERVVGVRREELRDLNPALRPAVYSGELLVPRGYRLRLPKSAARLTAAALADKIGASALFAAQVGPRYHRIGRGETIASVARRYGISARALAGLNGLETGDRLKRGRTLRLPLAQPPLLATRVTPVENAQPAPAAQVAPKTEPAPVAALGEAATEATPRSAYVVRRGDTLSAIAARVQLPATEIMRINSLRDANYIFEGQRLSLVASAPVDTRAPQPAAEPVAAQTGGEQAQAAPPAAVAASVEIDDYSVANDGTVRVIGAETLGHYADWLGLSAARLRQLNQLRYGEPLLLGRRLRLDFSLIAREQFEQRRREYHTRLQADYFEERRITGTQVHIVRRGESLWLIAQRYADLPIWLLQQYNPDSDLGDLRAGMQLVVPRVENSEPSLTGAIGPGSAETTR